MLNILQHVLTESHVHCFVSGIETIKYLDCKRFFTVYCEYIVHILPLQTELFYHCTDTKQASQFIAVIVWKTCIPFEHIVFTIARLILSS